MISEHEILPLKVFILGLTLGYFLGNLKPKTAKLHQIKNIKFGFLKKPKTILDKSK